MGNNTVSVITGASRGIGRAVALQLGQAGRTIVVNYRRETAAAEETVGRITDLGGHAVAVQADVSTEAGVQRLFAAAESYGRLDHFVSNAAGTSFRPAAEVASHHLRLSHEMNTHAFVRASQEAARLMTGSGAIVVLTSVGSTQALPHYALMGAEKASLEAWARYLACELAPRQVTVNAVRGGLVSTDSLDKYAAAAGLDQSDLVRGIPLGRLGTAGEIAQLVAFLLSPAAAYITGQVLVADGGLSVASPFPGRPAAPLDGAVSRARDVGAGRRTAEHPVPKNAEHPVPKNAEHPVPKNAEHPVSKNAEHPVPKNREPARSLPLPSGCSTTR
ncbi:SDR family oxidoreductase [Streptomyces europaeiscabiei]|uniref:SDR family oxidoreductase n=1 Tax=Streptomyces europaeiscabiei TaxID=146819 RepID=UPI0038F783BB